MRAVIAGYAVVAVVYLGLWGILIASGGSDAADFTAFYTGWTIVAEGQGTQLYDIPTQTEVQQQVLGGRAFEAGLNPYNNPPFAVFPFLPFTALSLRAGYLVWGVLQVGLMAWLAWRLLTAIAVGWSGAERSLLLTGAAAAPPLVITLLQGSLSLLLTVAVVELYLALRERRERMAALWLLVGGLKPQAVLGPALAVVAGRRWRLLGWAALGSLGLAGLTTIVLGLGIWASYLDLLGVYVSTFDRLSVRPSVMWNLRGTLTLLVGPDQAASQASLINVLSFAGQLGGLAIVGWIWRGSWRAGTPDFDLRFALTIVIGLLTSPHLNPHDDLLLVPAAAIAYGALRERPRGWAFGAALLVAPAVILATNPISANAVEGPPIRVPVLLMMLFVVWAAFEVRGYSGARVGQVMAPPAT